MSMTVTNEILARIEWHYRKGIPVTGRDLMRHYNIIRESTMMAHLNELADAGKIRFISEG